MVDLRKLLEAAVRDGYDYTDVQELKHRQKHKHRLPEPGTLDKELDSVPEVKKPVRDYECRKKAKREHYRMDDGVVVTLNVGEDIDDLRLPGVILCRNKQYHDTRTQLMNKRTALGNLSSEISRRLNAVRALITEYKVDFNAMNDLEKELEAHASKLTQGYIRQVKKIKAREASQRADSDEGSNEPRTKESTCGGTQSENHPVDSESTRPT